jgi:hypothetical protein
MKVIENPFDRILGANDEIEQAEHFTEPAVSTAPARQVLTGSVVTARFYGFDALDRPMVGGLTLAPAELLVAQSTVPLRLEDIGAKVVVTFDSGDVNLPIIIGVVQSGLAPVSAGTTYSEPLTVEANGLRVVLSAEREIVLRCGASSITLTRAGKVVISGAHVVSRSSGYNRIKGAVIDIN